MPMTAETLRVRTRKAEIDRELTAVDEQIRVYSKAKVYVIAHKSRQLWELWEIKRIVTSWSILSTD